MRSDTRRIVAGCESCASGSPCPYHAMGAEIYPMSDLKPETAEQKVNLRNLTLPETAGNTPEPWMLAAIKELSLGRGDVPEAEFRANGLAIIAKHYASRVAAPSQEAAPAPVQGSWPLGVHRAFVAGADWWQWHANKATMFASERDEAEAEAVRKFGPVGAEPSASQCGPIKLDTNRAGHIFIDQDDKESPFGTRVILTPEQATEVCQFIAKHYAASSPEPNQGCEDCLWHECAGKTGGCHCQCHERPSPSRSLATRQRRRLER